jgi:L-cystine transport system permease protein
MTLNTKFMVETFFAALAGVPVTLELTVVALLISFPLGFWMALKKENGGKLSRRLIKFYVSFVRGTPIVLQILFVYSLLPSLLNQIIKNVLGLSFNVFKINPILYAFLVFSLNTIAVLSEAFRSALLTVNHGQMEAALSVGLTRVQAYLRIIIPQALVAALPNICNATISLLKSTSLAYMMTVKDITAIAKLNAANGYNYIEAYIVIFVIYILLCTVIQLLFQMVERSLSAYKQRITPVGKEGKAYAASEQCA